MNCAIIGSTKIAEVHAENLIRKGVTEVTFISRSIYKRKKIISHVKKKVSKKVSFFHKSPEMLKDLSFNIICICSKTEVHDYHLKLLEKTKSIIVVEKPIVSLLKLNKSYENFLKRIYSNNKKIIVCYPYLYLSKSFNSFFPFKKKTKEIKFEFQTGGKSQYDDICVNLMPHALSFFHVFYKKNFIKKITKKEKIVKKNIWKATFNVDDIKFDLILKENPMKKTSLKISQDQYEIIRNTKIKKKKFINYIYNPNTKTKKIIKNPMVSFYNDVFKNLNNLSYYKKNKVLTFDIMKKNFFLLN